MVSYDAKKLVQDIIMTEEKVAELYRSFAEKVEDPTAKNVFTNLAADEEQHKKIYEGLLSKLPGGGMVELAEHEAEYTDLLMNSSYFKSEHVKKRYVESDALVVAERVERDSVLFYTQLMRIFPDFAKEEMEAILKQEQKHLKKVTDAQLDMIYPSLGL